MGIESMSSFLRRSQITIFWSPSTQSSSQMWPWSRIHITSFSSISKPRTDWMASGLCASFQAREGNGSSIALPSTYTT